VSGAHLLRVRRIYEEPQRDDGLRVLVDRLWPRGLPKEPARFDEWCKAVAPSTALRQWYGHDRRRFEEFADRYRRELADADHAASVDHLADSAARGNLTLLTATREVDISAAAVLHELLAHRLG
jgi:uncharacterized protein YeaO (DUF488 family)